MNQHVKRILSEVSKQHRVSVLDILSPSRYRPIVAARHEVFYRLCHERSYSSERIAAIFKRDGSSVRYGIGRHAITSRLPSRLSLCHYTLRLAMSRAYNENHRREVAA